jgi:hypothetical protein
MQSFTFLTDVTQTWCMVVDLKQFQPTLHSPNQLGIIGRCVNDNFSTNKWDCHFDQQTICSF